MHNFANLSERNKKEIENLYKLVNKLPAFKMRKTQLKSPFDKSDILIDYSLVEVNNNNKTFKMHLYGLNGIYFYEY